MIESDFFADFVVGSTITPIKHVTVSTLPDEVYLRVHKRNEVKQGLVDYYTPLVKGKEWLFELVCQFQPRTGKLLLEGGELWLRELPQRNPTMFHLGLAVQGKVVLVGRRYKGSNPSDPGYCKTGDRQFSLPEPIRMAYYHRFDGLNLPVKPVVGPSTRLLPFPVGRPWVPWNMYLEESRSNKKKYLDWLKERIPGVAPEEKGEPWVNFMMFLDSRSDNKGKEGDVFFVKNHVQDGVIYHVKDNDISKMKILAEPAEAIDRYCEHVLLGKSARFDFLPYTRDM